MPIPSATTAPLFHTANTRTPSRCDACNNGACANPKHPAKTETTVSEQIVTQPTSRHRPSSKGTCNPKIPSLIARRENDLWVDISNKRLPNSGLGSLFASSRFKGIQKCGSTSYEVEVDIQHVDVKESSLSGYLKINGLTTEFPELTTFFVGEIIGPKYAFLTRKWHALQSIDADHWKRFPSFQPYVNVFGDSDFVYDPTDNDFIYMRWKEQFLVPDHRVSSIDGASFAGFYYVCYQRSTDKITGYYFYRHNSNSAWLQMSRRYQELVLQHVPQRSFGNFEFC